MRATASSLTDIVRREGQVTSTDESRVTAAFVVAHGRSHIGKLVEVDALYTAPAPDTEQSAIQHTGSVREIVGYE